MLLSGEDDKPEPIIEDERNLNSEGLDSPLPVPEDQLIEVDGEGETEVESSPNQDLRMLDSISPQEARRRGANPVSHLVFSFPNTPVRSQTDLADHDRSDADDESGSERGTDEPLRFSSRHQFSDGQRFHDGHQSRSRSRGPLPLPTSTPSRTRTRSFFKSLLEKTKAFLHALNDIMTPPLYAAVLSLIVALIPPLQHTLLQHSKPLTGALKNAGDCSIPITLIVLGGYFYTPPNDSMSEPQGRKIQNNGAAGPEEPSSSRVASVISLMSNPTMKLFRSKQPAPTSARPSLANRRAHSLLSASWETNQPGETKTVVIALVSRMLIVPLLLFPLFWLSTSTDWQAVFEEYAISLFFCLFWDGTDIVALFSPVFVVACVLLASSPPAVTLAQVSGVFLPPSTKY